MKKTILALLLGLLLAASPSFAAWSFDEVDDDVQITDNAALTLSATAWTISGWFKLTDNVGTAAQYLMSWGGLVANPSINIGVNEASGVEVNKLFVSVGEGGGTTDITIQSSTTPGTSTAWQNVIVTLATGGVLTVYINGTSVGTSTNSAFNTEINVAGNLFFGARSDLNVDRFLGGLLAEWAAWGSRTITAGEIVTLQKYTANCVPNGQSWYVPMIQGFVEVVAGLTVTNNGATTGAAHPPISSCLRQMAPMILP